MAFVNETWSLGDGLITSETATVTAVLSSQPTRINTQHIRQTDRPSEHTTVAYHAHSSFRVVGVWPIN
jgi:hypothetical protein